MFTTPCIIRKNTPELRQKLEDLGYSNCIIEDGKYLFTTHGIFDCMYSNTGYEDLVRKGLVDCGDNEGLFLAFAAMRDDSDYMQYFTNGHDFIMCDREDWVDMYSVLCSGKSHGYQNVLDNYHKATEEEIMEQFKMES